MVDGGLPVGTGLLRLAGLLAFDVEVAGWFEFAPGAEPVAWLARALELGGLSDALFRLVFVFAVVAAFALAPVALGGRSVFTAPFVVVRFALFTGPPAAFASTTPFPLNTPGFGLAAIEGLPPLTDASCERFVPAWR